MNKKEWRKHLLAERMNLRDGALERARDLLLIRFQEVSLPFLQYLHTFHPLENRNEPDPEPMVRMLAFRNPGLQTAVPKLIGDQDMVHILVDNSTKWAYNSFGIAEPVEGETAEEELFDLVFVPLLGFDAKGNRIGYGKGYYDRFLSRCREDCLKIGLSFLEPLPELIEADPWDVPLDICITPQRVYEFK